MRSILKSSELPAIILFLLQGIILKSNIYIELPQENFLLMPLNNTGFLLRNIIEGSRRNITKYVNFKIICSKKSNLGVVSRGVL